MQGQKYVAPIIMLPLGKESLGTCDRKKTSMINNLLKKKIITHDLDCNTTRIRLFVDGTFYPRGPIEGFESDDEIENIHHDDVIIPEVKPIDVQQIPHVEWLLRLTGIENSPAPMEKLWNIIESTRDNRNIHIPSPNDLKDVATAIAELYDTMMQRMGYIILDRGCDPVKVIYNFISRGYHTFEAILEAPDLGVFFIDNERIDMPNFVKLFRNL